MSNSITKIQDDIDRYLALCKRYGEEPRYKHGSEDCYGAHAEELMARRHAEQQVRTSRR